MSGTIGAIRKRCREAKTRVHASGQIGHRFEFRLIVEQGLSHAVLTQTQGCEPITVIPNGNIK